MPADANPTPVLVVDDEAGVRSTLARFLLRRGYRALEADGGTVALRLQDAERPAAIICDIRMPDLSGVELVPRALACDPDVAIIMLTAIDEPRTAVECLRLGAHDYLLKPVDLEELRLSLEAALRLRRLAMERRHLEQWLTTEIATRTGEFEERMAAITELTLDALAAAGDWPGARTTIERLAAARGVTPDAIRAAVARKRD